MSQSSIPLELRRANISQQRGRLCQNKGNLWAVQVSVDGSQPFLEDAGIHHVVKRKCQPISAWDQGLSPQADDVDFARSLATEASEWRLNVLTEFKTTPLLHHSPKTLVNTSGLATGGPSTRLNLYQSVNSALRTVLTTNKDVLCFGEDVAFGGVFPRTVNLQSEFEPDRVFNTPISEQGIVGAAIGMAAEGARPVVEIQFAAYAYPAFDQIVNEASKFRYREGHTGANLDGMVIRMPCSGVGHDIL
jgi:hypothetical protein